ncbi:MAG: HPr family phosphocarrier protein [Sphingobium sp.]|nr:HPr family phosphocarrier protein [Sphingobium sp.]
MSDISQQVRISNKRGLHARASAKFVTLASGLPAHITVSKEGSGPVTGTSIMGLMMLGAAMGDQITISAAGPQAAESLTKLVTLVEEKFGEE